jgi:hypothetical protein
MTAAIAADLAALAAEVSRLSPNWTDMQRFYEARSEVAANIRRCARQIELSQQSTPARPRCGAITDAELRAARDDLARRNRSVRR